MTDTESTTRILRDASEGDSDAAGVLLPLVYDELRKLAAACMRQERAGHTLQPTALVHEAYLRMVNQAGVDWKSRAQFFSVAAQMIRRVLVDHARARNTAKRGGNVTRVELGESIGTDDSQQLDILALDECLEQLGRLKDRHRKVVELRYFGGMKIEEIAHVLGVSSETVKDDWKTARAWLRRRMEEAR